MTKPPARERPGSIGTTGDYAPSAHEIKRAQIAASAARLFATEGVARCNMGEIAKACGLAKPTLYHYYSTRDEILVAINDSAFQYLHSRLEARQDAGLTAAAELRAIIGDVFGLVHDLPGYSRVVFEHLRQLEPELRSRVLGRRLQYAEHLTQVLERGVRAKEFRRVDPKLTQLAILGMVNWSHQWYSPEGDRPPEEIADQFYQLIMFGLAP